MFYVKQTSGVDSLKILYRDQIILQLFWHNIIGYVPDIQFKVLLRESLYENLTFLY